MTRLRPNPDPANSLVASLTGVVDGLRQLQTEVGLRPYRVFAVVIDWTGKEEGRGDPVVTELELLPTPLVKFRGLRLELKTAGKTDRGYIDISEISPRFTEDQLQRSFHVKPLTDAQEAFYEVRQDAREGAEPLRRRFVIRGVPERDAENFQWTMRLSAQNQQRDRNGQPNRATRVWRK